MKRTFLSVCAAIFAHAGAAALDFPEGGAVMIQQEPASISLGGGSADLARLDTIAPDGVDASWGFSVATSEQPRFHYSIEAKVPVETGMRKGDTIFASFWMRATDSSIESGEATTLFRVQRTAPPWDRTLYGEAVAGSEWKLFYRAGRADADVPAGELAAYFSAGYPKQAFEIAGLRVVNLGPDVDPDTLPRMRLTYAGEEPDAAWRDVAAERIERLRKADLTVTVVDAQGRPIPDATVHVDQTRHAFWFGSAIAADWLIENWDTSDGHRYREKILEQFNGVALANQLKWARWERDPSIALRTLEWLNEHGIGVHGHVLIWPGLQKFRVTDNKEVWAAAQDDPQVLRDRIDGHFVDILTRTEGLVDDWDVINEPFTQFELIDLLGREEMVHWFELADEHAPDSRLFLNEFGILGGNGVNLEKQDTTYETIRFLLDRGAPIDAIGLQSHMGQGLTPPYRLMQILDRFGELGLDILITEFDTWVEDDDVRESYTRDFMTVMFSHPSVVGFTTWGFWEPIMYTGRSSMYDKDWNLMAVGKAYRGLVLDEWRTDETATTDDAGQAKLRGFKGQYTITVEGPDGQRGSAAISLNDTHRITITATR